MWGPHVILYLLLPSSLSLLSLSLPLSLHLLSWRNRRQGRRFRAVVGVDGRCSTRAPCPHPAPSPPPRRPRPDAARLAVDRDDANTGGAEGGLPRHAAEPAAAAGRGSGLDTPPPSPPTWPPPRRRGGELDGGEKRRRRPTVGGYGGRCCTGSWSPQDCGEAGGGARPTAG